MQQPIYGVFDENRKQEPKWFLKGFFKESDREMSFFPKFPETANYFEDPADLLYDIRRSLVVEYEHVIDDNLDRYPAEMQATNYPRRRAVDSAVEFAKRRVKRNYKTAIPQFHRGRVQLLLPLCLLSEDKADLALVVHRENEVYRATTILTLDMAYNNAAGRAAPSILRLPGGGCECAAECWSAHLLKGKWPSDEGMVGKVGVL
jgi:hypothetical protein